MSAPFDPSPPDPWALVRHLREGQRREARVLLYGGMGTGKSTLAAGLARAWPGDVNCLGADPGSPAFGVPGAINLGQWHRQGWRCGAFEPLCTLDAARFRLPLVRAAERLASRVAQSSGNLLIVDAPGVSRGVAGAELLHGLAEAAQVDAAIVLRCPEMDGLQDDLAALGCRLLFVAPHPEARRPGRQERESRRTGLWDSYLESAELHRLCLERLSVLGTPPPRDVPEAWQGRQVALLGSNAPMMGEVVEMEADWLTLRAPAAPAGVRAVLIRDAWRSRAEVLATAPAPARRTRAPAPASSPPPGSGGALEVRLGGIQVSLVNGVLGDPLLALRIADSPSRLLLDLGDAAGLPIKALHAVTHVFVSHGHFDHIGGFPALLRARLSGDPPPCRIYGPPGTGEHVAGFVSGVHWDRIGDTGPQFLVADVAESALCWRRIQPGRTTENVGRVPIDRGILLDKPGLRVRADTLDHGIPVLAFLVELDDRLHVREAALARRGLAPGPWLGALKRSVAAGDTDAPVSLPDGSTASAGRLAEELIRITPGTRIAYATDLADTADNRRRLTALARHADLLICEATFLQEDAAQAAATRHLTVAACVEIAREAEVARLLPFHFSRRYSHRLLDVHRALRAAAAGTALEGKVVGVY